MILVVILCVIIALLLGISGYNSDNKKILDAIYNYVCRNSPESMRVFSGENSYMIFRYKKIIIYVFSSRNLYHIGSKDYTKFFKEISLETFVPPSILVTIIGTEEGKHHSFNYADCFGIINELSRQVCGATLEDLGNTARCSKEKIKEKQDYILKKFLDEYGDN